MDREQRHQAGGREHHFSQVITRRALLKKVGAGLIMPKPPALLRGMAIGLGTVTLVPHNPPYNFSTFAVTSSFKLLGANILQAPNYVGLSTQPGGDYQYGYMF